MRARIALVLAGGLLLVACGGDGATGEIDGEPIAVANEAREGDRLPDVDVTGLTSGETERLSDIEGPAVVNLWATWCAPCRAEIPDFEEVHLARGDEIRFVGINVGEDPAVAAEFIDEVGATYDQYADLGGDVSTALRATAMPMTVVIDADGIVTTRHLGPLDAESLEAAIDDATSSATDDDGG